MAKRIVKVSPSQVKAAQLVVALDRAAGRESDPKVVLLAKATPPAPGTGVGTVPSSTMAGTISTGTGSGVTHREAGVSQSGRVRATRTGQILRNVKDAVKTGNSRAQGARSDDGVTTT